MSDEDQPPDRIWLDDDELKTHFELVRSRWRGSNTSGDMEPINDVPMVENEYTKQYLAARK